MHKGVDGGKNSLQSNQTTLWWKWYQNHPRVLLKLQLMCVEMRNCKGDESFLIAFHVLGDVGFETHYSDY